MASAALPEWLSDVPGDIAALFEELAMLQEHEGGRSCWSTTCCGAGTSEQVWDPASGGPPWWQNQRVVNRNRQPSHTPLRCYESVDQAFERKLADQIPNCESRA
jgi:hypothetical protein